MADIFLSKYNTSDSISGYNAPHKYRFARKKGMGEEDVLRIWNQQKDRVLNELVNQLKKFEDQEFIFATAPSRTTIFVDAINSIITERFEKAIDISSCFIREKGFDSGTTQELLTDDTLKGYFKIDNNCINQYELNNEIPILLLDDVYANGNTLRGMTLALEEVGINNTITTAVILQM